MTEKSGPHISIKAEPVFHIAGFNVTNSLLTSLVVTGFFLALALYYFYESKKDKKSRAYYFIHWVLLTIYNLFKSVLGDNALLFFPWVGTMFLYILLQNWFGLLPGVGSVLWRTTSEHGVETVPLFRANTADLNTTLTLGIIAVVLIQYYGFKHLGVKVHLSKYFNFKGPMDFALGILELISEASRVLSFSFRLYGNIFAGEVLIAIVASLIPVLITFPFLLMEIFVGVVQALVFSMLTAVFLNVAIHKHE